jgi:hypothetical protein
VVAPTPGTVSKILWHFTGGPRWNVVAEQQDARRKPPDAAFDALVAILKSRELRLGQYHEVVRVSVTGRTYSKESRKFKERRMLTTLRSAPVCCLADIPIAHLSYHAKRYGKFALGFHRPAVVKHGFNPVLYTPTAADVIEVLHAAFSHTEYPDLTDLRLLVASLDEYTTERSSIQSEIEMIEESLSAIHENLKDLLAFVKTFGPREYHTIYSEREWRSVDAYKFAPSEIAMIVVPRRERGKSYFAQLTEHLRDELQLPNSVPVIPWEDLVES